MGSIESCINISKWDKTTSWKRIVKRLKIKTWKKSIQPSRKEVG